MKPPRKPWKSALFAGLTCILICTVLGGISVAINGSDDYYAAGYKVGNGAGQLSIIVAAVAYFGARRRYKQHQMTTEKLDDVFK